MTSCIGFSSASSPSVSWAWGLYLGIGEGDIGSQGWADQALVPFTRHSLHGLTGHQEAMQSAMEHFVLHQKAIKNNYQPIRDFEKDSSTKLSWLGIAVTTGSH